MRDGCQTFFHPDPVIDGKIAKFLHEAAGPVNRRSHRSLCISKPEENIFAVLRKKARSGLEHACLAAMLVSIVTEAPIASRLLFVP